MVLGSPPMAGARPDDTADDAGAIRILEALSDYRDAETALRKRARDEMSMNETDLTALRYAVGAKFRGRDVTPTDLMNHLGVTMASVTVMIDRLEHGGYVTREMNPNDRRSRLVSSTDLADERIQELLQETRGKMATAAGGLTTEEVDCVVALLRRLQLAADSILAKD